MPQIINTNMMSLNTQRSLNMSQGSMQISLQRLSSGLRINSAKDDAELSMIVDLLRNDLGKVCAAGTVRVAQHKRLEAYSNVYHLVSVVEGRLDPDKDRPGSGSAGGASTAASSTRVESTGVAAEDREALSWFTFCKETGCIGASSTGTTVFVPWGSDGWGRFPSSTGCCAWSDAGFSIGFLSS